MSKHHLLLSPIQVTESDWYYEEVEGICLIHEIKNDHDVLLQTDKIVIPWSKILKSVERYKK